MSGQSFYQANSAADLHAALQAILGILNTKCSYLLAAAPASPSLIRVSITQSGSSTVLTSNQYQYIPSPSPSVLITDDAVCAQLNNSTANNPVTLAIDYASEP